MRVARLRYSPKRPLGVSEFSPEMQRLGDKLVGVLHETHYGLLSAQDYSDSPRTVRPKRGSKKVKGSFEIYTTNHNIKGMLFLRPVITVRLHEDNHVETIRDNRSKRDENLGDICSKIEALKVA